MAFALILVLLGGIQLGSTRHCHLHETGRAVEFTYDDPFRWANDFPECGGSSQSPINIETRNVRSRSYQTPLNLDNYQINVPGENMTNNGHTVQISINKDVTITGGPAGSDVYKLSSFHFHFGRSSDEGSEHQINRDAFSMEIHFVHYNTKYGTMDRALNYSDGALVIGVLAKSMAQRGASVLDVISDNLNKIRKPETNTTVENDILLSSIFPDDGDVKEYFTYQGSLTTPMCRESVTWVLARNPIRITETQLKSFRKLQNECRRKIAGNFRPVQPLNGRKVYFVSEYED